MRTTPPSICSSDIHTKHGAIAVPAVCITAHTITNNITSTIVSALLGHKVVGVIGLAFASRTSVVEQEAVSSPCAEDVCLAAAKLHTVATTLLGSARTIGHDLEVGVDPRTVVEDVGDEILGASAVEVGAEHVPF